MLVARPFENKNGFERLFPASFFENQAIFPVIELSRYPQDDRNILRCEQCGCST